MRIKRICIVKRFKIVKLIIWLTLSVLMRINISLDNGSSENMKEIDLVSMDKTYMVSGW